MFLRLMSSVFGRDDPFSALRCNDGDPEEVRELPVWVAAALEGSMLEPVAED